MELDYSENKDNIGQKKTIYKQNCGRKRFFDNKNEVSTKDKISRKSNKKTMEDNTDTFKHRNNSNSHSDIEATNVCKVPKLDIKYTEKEVSNIKSEHNKELPGTNKMKEKPHKKALAKTKNNKIIKSEVFNAPPKRSAALNASAIVNCMLERRRQSPPGKIKKDNTDMTTENKQKPLNIFENTDLPNANCHKDDNTVLNINYDVKNKLKDLPKDKTEVAKVKRIIKNTGNFKDKKKDKKIKCESKIKHKIQDHIKKTTKQNIAVEKKLEKTLKIRKNKRNEDMKEIVVGKRMASLNASAMLHAGYAREEKRVRRDPLTIAIEASLRDAKEREIKEMLGKVEIEEQAQTKVNLDSEHKIDHLTENNQQKDSLKTKSKAELTEDLNSKKNIGEGNLLLLTGKNELLEPDSNILTDHTSEELASLEDLKTKLIESAIIKSKMAKQCSDEKEKKKAKKSQHGNVVNKIKNISTNINVNDSKPKDVVQSVGSDKCLSKEKAGLQIDSVQNNRDEFNETPLTNGFKHEYILDKMGPTQFSSLKSYYQEKLLHQEVNAVSNKGSNILNGHNPVTNYILGNSSTLTNDILVVDTTLKNDNFVTNDAALSDINVKNNIKGDNDADSASKNNITEGDSAVTINIPCVYSTSLNNITEGDGTVTNIPLPNFIVSGDSLMEYNITGAGRTVTNFSSNRRSKENGDTSINDTKRTRVKMDQAAYDPNMVDIKIASPNADLVTRSIVHKSVKEFTALNEDTLKSVKDLPRKEKNQMSKPKSKFAISEREKELSDFTLTSCSVNPTAAPTATVKPTLIQPAPVVTISPIKKTDQQTKIPRYPDGNFFSSIQAGIRNEDQSRNSSQSKFSGVTSVPVCQTSSVQSFGFQMQRSQQYQSFLQQTNQPQDKRDEEQKHLSDTSQPNDTPSYNITIPYNLPPSSTSSGVILNNFKSDPEKKDQINISTKSRFLFGPCNFQTGNIVQPGENIGQNIGQMMGLAPVNTPVTSLSSIHISQSSQIRSFPGKRPEESQSKSVHGYFQRKFPNNFSCSPFNSRNSPVTKAIVRPLMSADDLISRRDSHFVKPRGTVTPILSSTSSITPRQILRKEINTSQQKPQPIKGVGQIIGSGLVAAVLPTSVQSTSFFNKSLATSTSSISQNSRQKKSSLLTTNNTTPEATSRINHKGARFGNKRQHGFEYEDKNKDEGIDSHTKCDTKEPIEIDHMSKILELQRLNTNLEVKIKNKSYSRREMTHIEDQKDNESIENTKTDLKKIVKSNNEMHETKSHMFEGSHFPSQLSNSRSPIKKLCNNEHISIFQTINKASHKIRISKSKLSNVLESNDTPTFHIPQMKEGCSTPEPGISAGHPGLPNGLLKMTSSLIHNSKFSTKMLQKDPRPQLLVKQRITKNNKEMDKEDLKRKWQQQSIHEDQLPKLELTVPSHNCKTKLLRNEDEDFLNVMRRQRLKLKPTKSPKLEIEQYLSVAEKVRKNSLSYPEASENKINHPENISFGGIKKTLDSKVTRDRYGTTGDTNKGELSANASRKKAQRKQLPIPWSKQGLEPPKNGGGWKWKGDGFISKVHLNNDETTVERVCYKSMRHEEGDEEVSIMDCVLLACGNKKIPLPYIAKVISLWENPDDGEMMMSMLWFYRPEHTDIGRQGDDLKNEVFASKHRDHMSVACIEDKCFVMTFNEYCRYMRFSVMMEEGVIPPWNIVPEKQDGYPRSNLLPDCQVANDRVFLCRKVYDIRGRRMLKNPY